MQFQDTLIEKIITGEKTQTRRLVKPGEKLVIRNGWKTVLLPSGRIKWQVGRDYAVQNGRGKPCVRWLPDQPESGFFNGNEYIPHSQTLRITLLDIREEDARSISHLDSLEEGVGDLAPKYAFLNTWAKFYDPTIAFDIWATEYDLNLPDHCPLWLWDRPDDRYLAFPLTFKIKEIS